MVFPLTFPFTWGDCDPLPKIRVRVAFADDPLDAASGLTWTTLAAVRSYHFSRGRQHQLNRIEAGTCTVVLGNEDGDYYPDNAGGSYYPNVLPMKRINIQASFDGGSTWYDRFTGYIDQWVPKWGAGGVNPTCEVTATDGYTILSRYEINDGAGYAQEASGTRIGNVADAAGWPAADRSLDSGQETMKATGALAAENALSHAQAVQDSEVGILEIDKSGLLVFEDRSHRNSAPHTTAQAIFGDGSGEDEYHELTLGMDADLLYNEIRFTRDGGSEQVVTFSTSQTAYGKRVLSRSGMLNTTDDSVFLLATMTGTRQATPATRAKTMTIHPASNPSNLLPKVLEFDISTRLTARKSVASLDGDYFIEGVDESWAPAQGIVTRWALSDAARQMADADPFDVTLVPDGDVATQWNAGSYTNVVADDANYSTETRKDGATRNEGVAFSAFPYSTGTINSVEVKIKIKQETGSGGVFDWGIDQNFGSTQWQGAQALPGSKTEYTTGALTVSPFTGVAWTFAELNALSAIVQYRDPGSVWNSSPGWYFATAIVNFTPQW